MLTARIVAVVDLYDALVHARVYKPVFPEERAVARIRGDSGTHFAVVVDHILEVLPEFREAVRDPAGAGVA